MPTESPASPSRRGFLFTLGLALNTIAGALVGIPIVGFLLSPVRKVGEQAWISLGPTSDFPENQTRLATYVNPFRSPLDGETANVACWVRRLSGDSFQVFAINCAHLGCPVRWFEESNLFLCPCHGGSYYADGERASGPPPRGLYHVVYRVTRVRDLDVLEIQAPHYPTIHNPLRHPA